VEHDEGDQSVARKAVSAGVQVGVDALIGAISAESPAIAALAAPILQEIAPDISKGIQDLLGFDDDLIGRYTRYVTAKTMILKALGGTASWKGVTYSYFDGPFTGGGSEYDVGFLIRAA
jgi:hypothetical protein